ncbi:VanW family protein [Candidatus Arthromitus sp. SFB-rat-Yit]|uniref:VanW family protein n=1 Tax=Candidatus Arthromitus sp. SFB-rat-Yit TaxID=1041504 RepID=UPI000227A68D|nr:VanW family protein [Candidatus Arthromitus sp. SFB-rat-Yit]BAK81695.1 vanW family protein [Candidatus Arthromitus sp. SFB-rat-Yit]
MYRILRTYKNLRLEKSILSVIFNIFIILSIALPISFINYKISSIVNDWEGKVYEGVTINNVDVSGLSRSALKEFLIEKFSGSVTNGSVEFKLNDESTSIQGNELGITYDYDKAIEEAFSFSEGLTYTKKVNHILNPHKTIDIKLSEIFDISDDQIDSLYDKLSSKFNVNPINSEVYIVDGQPIIIQESYDGIEIDKEVLIRMIKDVDPSSAFRNGVKLNTKNVDPKYTSDVLGKINGKISSYSTSYKSSSNERATNVELSANFINGTILLPGESFSFNSTVGQRTRERGFKDAAIIVGNVYESGLGGGICQTSSTLHQAVVRAGILPTQRRNHSLPTSYMPLGFDAAVAWGSLDYVFKNTYDFPILIDVSTEGRNLTISIYGDVTAVDKTYSTVAENQETIAYSTKYVNDNTLAKGTQVVQKNGVNGSKVKVYLVSKEKSTGKTVEKKYVWNDYYAPQDKIIRVGTK